MEIVKDVPKPETICPECGNEEAFFHCALQDEGGIYDWGTLVTCLECKTPYNLQGE